MKKLLLVLLVVAAMASPAWAGQIQVGYLGSAYGPHQTGQGGEFTFNPLQGWLDVSAYGQYTKNIGVAGTFQTFCLEGTENLDGYANTYTGVLNTDAVYGNTNPPTSDPLSVGTGWLYRQFATNDWTMGLVYGASYDYTNPGRSVDPGSSADLFQKAIWWLEGEKGITYSAANPFMFAVVSKFGTQAGAKADGAAQYGVFALNLWTSTRGAVQDGLYLSVPDGGATLMLLGGALLAVGALRRRIR